MWATDPGKTPDSEVYHNGDGFSYYKNRCSHDGEGNITTIYLRCVKHRSDGCPGSARIQIDDLQQLWRAGNDHICHADHVASGLRHMRRNIIVASEQHPFQDPKDVYESVAFRYPNNVAANLPQHQLKSAMYRARKFPNVPYTLAELDVLIQQHPNIVASLDGHDSLYSATVGPPGHQSTIFASRRSLRFMPYCEDAYGDATFTPTPILPNGSQVYVLSTMKNYHVIILLVAIMESKDYLTHSALLEHVRAICPRFNPKNVRVDYERQQMRAWQEKYPLACIKGCYIHFVRAVSKKVAALGFRQLANRIHALRSLIRAFTAIPLLPKCLLARGFEVLVRVSMERNLFEILIPFLYYFMKTWLQGWRKESVSVFREKNRTNNASESANRMLRRRTGPHHPSLWKFLNGLRKVEQASYLDIRRYRNGMRLGPRRAGKSVTNDERIRQFTNELLQGNISIRRFLYCASNRALNLLNMHL